jgi:hypothetical protein
MTLDMQYKDVTFETLNAPGFLQGLKKAYPRVPWDKPYRDFLATGQIEARSG